MSLFLHLSDLHLGPVSSDDLLDDHKSQIVPRAERSSRQSLIERTLKVLGDQLNEAGRKLDAILITGDITSRNQEHGFQQLSSLLEMLGDCCPSPKQIVVIPGNHDVARATLPSSRERYAHFLTYTRQPAQPFITPLLEGIDLDAKGRIQGPTQDHYLLSPNNDWLIVPMNSANYCQSVEPLESLSDDLWNQLPDLIGSQLHVNPDAIRSDLGRLRNQDVARISDAQFDGVRELLNTVDRRLRAKGVDPTKLVRIALIHHHLLPVSIAEEFKSFESITNLGLLRTFLRENGFTMVLHGHKHRGLIYYDDIPDVQGNEASKKVLVVSGATVDTGGNEQELCRLIKIDANEYLPRAFITKIPALRTSMPLPKPEPETYLLPRDEGLLQHANAQPTLIRGKTLDELYTQLIDLWESLPDQSAPYLYNIVCQLEDSSTASSLPKNYPRINEVDRAKWLEDIVNWWQLPESKLSEQWRFTHGSRIYAYQGENKIDQVEKVVQVLKEKRDSSRAVITLLLPPSDKIDDQQVQFPSFCLVQFIIRQESKEKHYLDCVGYFRKQELRYWWPVNMAELVQLQRTIQDNLLSDLRGLGLGTITTITAIGTASSSGSLPKVAVPAIDRELDKKGDPLWSLTYALFWQGIPDRQGKAERWKELLDDLIPPKQQDRDGVTVAIDGLEYILKLGQRFSSCHPNVQAKELLFSLEHLITLNKSYVVNPLSKKGDRSTYLEWRAKVEQLVERIKGEVESLLE